MSSNPYQNLIENGISAEVLSLLADSISQDLEFVDTLGNTLLHLAARRRADSEPIISELIGLGLDVNAKNNIGRTPLHAARSVEAVYALAEHGADLNILCEADVTPLYQSMWRRNEDIALALLESGADKDILSPEGEPMLVVAFKFGLTRVQAKLQFDPSVSAQRVLELPAVLSSVSDNERGYAW